VEGSNGDGNPRARIAIAVGAGVLLLAIVVIVAVASGGGSEREAVAADPACIKAWNADEDARAYGRHNFSFHLYTGALVTHLDNDGNEVDASAPGALCAVIFPSKVLDAEPFAAGQVLRGRDWSPISSLDRVQVTRVAELQVLAAGSPNTTLDVQGVLKPL
jgi:hypothetical protein